MRSIVAFGVTGGISTVMCVLVGLFSYRIIGLAPFNANLVGFSVGFFISYYGHRTFSFRSEGKVSRSMPRFFVIAATNLVLSQAIVFTIVNVIGRPYWQALAIMVTIVPAFTYVMGRMWAFNDGKF
ncbi:MAG: GtrA family protein [Rhodobacteraceae bacterium]|nr:GtrA family protein [Paracoccaceae bacterium]MCP5341227.1 GtrA family protein [Paracoccaceae bacterium]